MVFNKIEIGGKADVRYLFGKVVEFSDDDMGELAQNGIQNPAWNTDTKLLAQFNNTLTAGGYSDELVIDRYNIYRKKVGEDVIRTVATDVFKNGVCDYNVGSNSEYIYYVVPVFKVKGESGDEYKYGEMAESNTVTVKNHNWSIIGLKPIDSDDHYEADEDNNWTLQLDLSAGDFKINDKKSIHDSVNQFPMVTDTDVDYLTTSVEVKLGDIDCGTREFQGGDIEFIKKWRRFCKNGDLKLLKDIAGHVIPCEIHDCSYTVDEALSTLETCVATLKFNVVQLKDNDKISAYAENDFSES